MYFAMVSHFSLNHARPAVGDFLAQHLVLLLGVESLHLVFEVVPVLGRVGVLSHEDVQRGFRRAGLKQHIHNIMAAVPRSGAQRIAVFVCWIGHTHQDFYTIQTPFHCGIIERAGIVDGIGDGQEQLNAFRVPILGGFEQRRGII